MIQRQLKLKLTKAQEATLKEWLWILTGAWNTAIRRIGQDASDGVYHSEFNLQNQVRGHSKRLGIPSHTLGVTFAQAHRAWARCFKKLAKKPRLKSARRPLKSVPFPDPIKSPSGNRILLPLLGKLRYHRQDIPKGRIKCARLVRRASGWYCCLFIDTQRRSIERVSFGSVGIDPGFKDLLTLSTGEKISHPRELEASANRLAQAQRGHDKVLAARLQERTANQRKNRNHKLSLDLVRRFTEIFWSRDNAKGIARTFGKSVTSSNHSQLRQMLKYKCLAGGTQYVEVDSKNSTRTCSACGSLTGPQGLAGLKVRYWECQACGGQHDRDVNAAVNTLVTGAGRALEGKAEVLRQEAAGCGASKGTQPILVTAL